MNTGSALPVSPVDADVIVPEKLGHVPSPSAFRSSVLKSKSLVFQQKLFKIRADKSLPLIDLLRGAVLWRMKFHSRFVMTRLDSCDHCLGHPIPKGLHPVVADTHHPLLQPLFPFALVGFV